MTASNIFLCLLLRVETVDCGVALLKAEAVCVYSDTPGTVEVAVAVRDAPSTFNAKSNAKLWWEQHIDTKRLPRVTLWSGG